MYRSIGICMLLLFSMSCQQQFTEGRFIDWQGHRGARGVLPENSLEGFIYALDRDMTTLEMDVVISADSQVVISHEPYVSSEICLDTNGRTLSAERQKELNIYHMTYEEVALYDCGSKPHPRFSKQQKQRTYKPLLRDAIEATEAYAKSTQRPLPYYNIELKSKPEEIGLSQPSHDLFAQLVLAVIEEAGIADRAIIQSFDPAALNAAYTLNPRIGYSFLVEKTSPPWKNKLEALAFTPDVLSPDYRLVDQHLIEFAAEKDMLVIPWTVNDPKEARQLIKLGVDGLITDYPALKKQVEERRH